MLDKEAEERGVGEGENVAVNLAEEQKLEEGEMVGGHTSETLSKDPKEVASGNEGLETDTPTTKIYPGTLDISGLIKDLVAVPLASVTARIIEDLDLISYPEGITGPKQELNVNSKKGNFM